MLVLRVTHLCGIHCHQFSLPSLTVNVFGFSCILCVFIDKRLLDIFKRRSFLRNSIHRIWSTIQPKKIDHNGQIFKIFVPHENNSPCLNGAWPSSPIPVHWGIFTAARMGRGSVHDSTTHCAKVIWRVPLICDNGCRQWKRPWLKWIEDSSHYSALMKNL